MAGVSEWDGRGLPPAAQARMQRFAADGVRTSLLDVNGMASVTAVGLPPVGEVMGCMVQPIPRSGSGRGGCYAGHGGWSRPPTSASSAQPKGYTGYRPYVEALYRGYDTAIMRMLTEARAMGADGVLEVRLSVNDLGQVAREFVALGTAVRSPGRVHPPHPFVTDLPASDVVKLLHAGWVPATIALGISVAVRHLDLQAASQMTSRAGNTEVSGYTRLVQRVRAEARARFTERVADCGADGVLLSAMELRTWDRECGEGSRDHVAESRAFGTAIACFDTARGTSVRPLSVVPLRRWRTRPG